MNKLFAIGLVIGTLMAGSAFAQGPAGSGPAGSGPTGSSPGSGPAGSAAGAASGASSYGSGATSSAQADTNDGGYSLLEAESVLEARGYTEVAGLNKDKDGTWHGTATKGDETVNVSVDSNGNDVAE